MIDAYLCLHGLDDLAKDLDVKPFERAGKTSYFKLLTSDTGVEYDLFEIEEALRDKSHAINPRLHIR